MKASKFSDAQKASILKQGADGLPVADICRRAEISQATYFNWKKKYDGLLPTEMRRLNANGFLANVLLYSGEPQTAAIHAKRAIRHMPVYPPWFVEILAAAYRDAGMLDLAIITAREVPCIAPLAMHGRLVLASALARAGWLADARCVVHEARVLDANKPHAWTVGSIAALS